MAYLITCSGSKRQPSNSYSSSLKLLSFSNELHDTREKLIKLLEFNLDWNNTMPAWQLYSGTYSRLYPRVSETNWMKEGVEIKILSALFGWIKHTDYIPYYDLQMLDFIKSYNNMRVWKYWYNCNLLKDIVERQDIDLLSNNYRKAITGSTLPVATESGAQFTDRGVQKGIWLNNQLDNI